MLASKRLLMLLVVAAAAAVPARAQNPDLSFSSEPEARGTSYFVFAEPGAPTFQVYFLGAGVRNGVYKFQEGTSFLEALALAGGTARSDSVGLRVTTSVVRLVRLVGGTPQTIYEAQPEDVVTDRPRLPALQDGDVIETEVTTEILEERKRVTFLDVLGVVSRLASVASVILLLTRRINGN